MRSTADRIRHAVCFEIIGVVIVTPLAGWAFNAGFAHIGALAVAMSLLATIWNYVYNVLFDHALLRWRGRIRKRPLERVVHAFIFEFGMLLLSLPPVMWWMGYGLKRALTMALSLMAFYLVYTYIYNWLYDILFPVPEANGCDS